MKVSGFVAALLLTSASAIAGGSPGVFDYYVLSLSWSPTYCTTSARPNPAECATSRGFIVHGLWPQYETGYPSDCPSNMPRSVRQETIDGIADIMPGASLVKHEWQTHGVCSGLSQGSYFAQVRSAFQSVRLPASLSGRTLAPREIEQAFIAANPRMTTGGIAVVCRRGLLEEVRICLTKQLGFRPCPEVDRQSCRVPEITVPRE